MLHLLFLAALAAVIWLLYSNWTSPTVSGPVSQPNKPANLKEFLASTYDKTADELEHQQKRGQGDAYRSAARQKEIDALRRKAAEIRNGSAP